ncbi:hypothetical protein [Paenibacillus periandrae]|uniref:hypothetical protein n=1 Tax=Paenibacillus periandrae TaxID=1761741 RepID=UPI001F092245|nr:hypothetical protein [Paenibacillus periandrae]
MSNLLFEGNKNEIMDFESWKAIKNLEIKTQLIKHWRTIFSDKDIKASWKVNTGTFYYQLRKCGIGRRSQNDDLEQAAGAMATQLLIGNPNSLPKDSERTIIDATYEVIPKLEKNLDLPAVREDVERKTAAVTSGAYLNFDFKGDFVLIEKKFKNMLGLLEDEGLLRVRVEIFRE